MRTFGIKIAVESMRIVLVFIEWSIKKEDNDEIDEKFSWIKM